VVVIVVSDTSILSALAITGYLALLPEIYGRVLIPLAVANELKRGSEQDPRIGLVLSVDWIEICETGDRQLVESLQNEYHLDRGESEAIALALEIKAEELLIDERLGRREAMRRGLSITGLLGILLVAKRRGLVREVKPIMNKFIEEANFRVSNNLYVQLLLMAGEE
jgi:predicted nucleic acid-binding protein